MPDTQPETAYIDALALLERALALCDDAAIGRSATPHLDLALNLLRAECQASRALTPARD